MDNGLLTTLVLFTPFIGFLALLFFNEQSQKEAIKWTAFGFSILTLVFALVMWSQFDNSQADLQFTQDVEWLNIQVAGYPIVSHYNVGVDGLSILLVVLTAFIMPIAIMASFKAGVLEERGRQKLYYALLMLLEWAMLGVFVIQDLIIFYVFWEVTLVPMYFLIGIWGSEDRVYAAVKFFLYTMAGSILMLIAILYVGNTVGSFQLPDIIAAVQNNPNIWNDPTGISANAASASTVTGSLLFFAFFVAFAIKVPVFPFHSWLPDAHVQAPTAGSVILAGVLLKMGTYGLVRFNIQMFPLESIQWAPLIGGLAVIGIIYGAWVSYAQDNVKKLVAYSSVSHLGFVVLGIFALNSAGIQGATLQMVNHGISTGGLFLLVGMLYERWHTKDMGAYGGVWNLMPVFGSIALVIAFSSMGLPGMNGFIGEFTILLGSIGSKYLGFFFTLFGTIGVILAATYILKMYQHVFMGEKKEAPHADENTYKLHWTELAVLIPILVAIFWIGIQPGGFFDNMAATTMAVVENINNAPVTAAASAETPAEEAESAAEEEAAEEMGAELGEVIGESTPEVIIDLSPETTAEAPTEEVTPEATAEAGE